MGLKKTFVLDTNVILHDYKSIFNFEENNIVIPITVLEELDKFKKGTDLINFHAREFMRELDNLAGDELFSGGVSMGEDKGVLFVETGKPFSLGVFFLPFLLDPPDPFEYAGFHL